MEATVLYPEAGGSSSFARHAFNEAASFFAAWAQMLTYIVTVAISAFFVPHYLAVFWEPLGHGPADVFFGIGLVALLALLNIKGTEESTRLNLVLAIADLLTQIVLVVIGLAIVFDPDLLITQIDLGTSPTWGDFALGIAVGMVAYTGIETISNMAEEARSAHRTIPQGVGLRGDRGGRAVRAAARDRAVGDAGEQVNGEFTTELGTTYADDPVLGIVANLGLSAGLTDVLEVYVGILAAVILLIATNAALIGLSRLTFSMGQYRQLPEALRQIHPRFKTPYVAIIVFSGVAALVMAPGETAFLGTIYAFGATLSFTVAHVSVIRLRRLRPLEGRPVAKDGTRSWRPPGNVRIRGVADPALGDPRRPGNVRRVRGRVVLDPVVLATGGGWMIVGSLLYYLYRRNQGLPLTADGEGAHLAPLGVEEPEYAERAGRVRRRRPVQRGDGRDGEGAGGRKRRAIHVVSLITVPSNLPLDARARRRGERCAVEDRAGEADLRPARDGQRRAGAPGPVGGRRS